MPTLRDGDLLRKVRVARGLLQRELAARVGCAQTTVSRLEAGVVEDVDLRLAAALARGLAVPLDLLFDVPPDTSNT